MFLKYRKFLSLLLVLLVIVPVPGVHADTSATGPITHYNGVIFGDMTALQADTEGALAVMGNAAFGVPGNGYDIGGAHSGVYQGEYSHIGLYTNKEGHPSFLLGGALTINSHRTGVDHGITLMKESNREASQAALELLECSSGIQFTNDNAIDSFFTSAWQTVTSASSAMWNATSETVTTPQLRSFSSQDLSRFTNHSITDSKLNILVVNVDEPENFLSESIFFPDLSAYDLLIINIPAETVNFTGGAIYYKGSTVLTEPRAFPSNGVTKELSEKIVWNLPNAETVDLASYDVFGSVLAPNAAVTGSGGSINGLLAARTFRQINSMELHAFRLGIGEKIWELTPEDPEEPDDPVDPTKTVAADSKDGANGALVEPGSLITYEITYYNHEVEAADVAITDELDPHVIFRDASHGGNHNGEDHEVTWFIKNVPGKTGGSVTLTVEVAKSALYDGNGNPLEKPEVENSAWVQIGNNSRQKTNPVTNPLEPEDPETPIPPEPEGPDDPKDPEKEVSTNSEAGLNGATVEVEDLITYKINFYNHEATPADVIITDTLDPGVNFHDSSHDGKYDSDNHQVNWLIKGASPRTGGSVTITVEVTERALRAADGGTLDEPQIENYAYVQIGNNARQKTKPVTNPLKPEKPENPDPEPPEEPDPEEPAKSIAAGSAAGQKDSPVKVGDLITYEIAYYHKVGSVTDGKQTDEKHAGEGEDEDPIEPSLEDDLLDHAHGGNSQDTEAVISDPEPAAGDGDSVDEMGTDQIQAQEVEENNPEMSEDDTSEEGGTDVRADIGHNVNASEISEDTTTHAIITIRDTLEKGLDFVEASHGGVYDKGSHTVIWTVKDVEEDTGGAVFLTVRVNKNAAKQVENTAYVQIENNPEQETNPVKNPLEEEAPTKSRRRRTPNPVDEPDPEDEENDPVKEPDEEEEDIVEDLIEEPTEDPSDQTVAIRPHVSPPSGSQKANPKTGAVQFCLIPGLILTLLIAAVISAGRNRR